MSSNDASISAIDNSEPSLPSVKNLTAKYQSLSPGASTVAPKRKFGGPPREAKADVASTLTPAPSLLPKSTAKKGETALTRKTDTAANVVSSAPSAPSGADVTPTYAPPLKLASATPTEAWTPGEIHRGPRTAADINRGYGLLTQPADYNSSPAPRMSPEALYSSPNLRARSIAPPNHAYGLGSGRGRGVPVPSHLFRIGAIDRSRADINADYRLGPRAFAPRTLADLQPAHSLFPGYDHSELMSEADRAASIERNNVLRAESLRHCVAPPTVYASVPGAMSDVRNINAIAYDPVTKGLVVASVTDPFVAVSLHRVPISALARCAIPSPPLPGDLPRVALDAAPAAPDASSVAAAAPTVTSATMVEGGSVRLFTTLFVDKQPAEPSLDLPENKPKKKKNKNKNNNNNNTANNKGPKSMQRSLRSILSVDPMSGDLLVETVPIYYGPNKHDINTRAVHVRWSTDVSASASADVEQASTDSTPLATRPDDKPTAASFGAAPGEEVVAVGAGSTQAPRARIFPTQSPHTVAVCMEDDPRDTSDGQRGLRVRLQTASMATDDQDLAHASAGLPGVTVLLGDTPAPSPAVAQMMAEKKHAAMENADFGYSPFDFDPVDSSLSLVYQPHGVVGYLHNNDGSTDLLVVGAGMYIHAPPPPAPAPPAYPPPPSAPPPPPPGPRGAIRAQPRQPVRPPPKARPPVVQRWVLHALRLPAGATEATLAGVPSLRTRFLCEWGAYNTYGVTQCGRGSSLVAVVNRQATPFDYAPVSIVDTSLTDAATTVVPGWHPPPHADEVEGMRYQGVTAMSWGGGVLHVAYTDRDERDGLAQTKFQLTRLWVTHVPWHQAVTQRLVSGEFHSMSRALAHLRWREEQSPVGPASDDAASGDVAFAPAAAMWSVLPMEVFELIIGLMWRDYLRPSLILPNH